LGDLALPPRLTEDVDLAVALRFGGALRREGLDFLAMEIVDGRGSAN
jgi:hypothetical protein